MAGLSTTAADAVLKEDYKGPVREQLNNNSVVFAAVAKNEEDIVGRRAVLALHVGRNSGIGARGERQPLPAAGAQQYEDIYVPIRSNYARIELTGQVIKVMDSDRGAFIRAMRSEMDVAVVDAKRDMARQVWGTSDGRVAELGVTTASNTVVLDATTTETQLDQLEEGFRVDIGTLADPDSVAAGREVLSVDRDAKTIVIDGAVVTTTAAQSLFRAGAGGASDNSGRSNDGQIELTGLQHIVDDDSTLHTLSPATEPRWKAAVDANGGTGRNISENLVTKVLMQAERRAGPRQYLLVGSDGVFRSYGNLLTSLKRFVDDLTLEGGFTGLKVGSARMGTAGGASLALTWDRDAPANSLYGIAVEDLQFYRLADWDWMDRDGAVLNRVSGYDAYEAVMFCYGDMGCSRRNSQFVIRDINES